MQTPPEKLLSILQECFKPRESGWLWVLMWQDGDDAGIVNEITDEYDDATMADALARIINGVGPDNAWLAVCRPEGQPREKDREFWRRLRSQVDADTLVDLVVFNETSVWSMRDEDSAAQSRAV